MSKPRILLISSHHLFGESMEAILRAETGIELVGPWKIDDQDICQRMDEERPSGVVIADENLYSASAAELTKSIIEQYPNVTVIRTALNEKVLRIFSTHTLPARGNDLLETIRGCVSPAQETDKANEK
ncbi:MAG: hypothetical protein IT313_06995 [Anaerolineales bacterium]|nr:hypothetical protein [Anaerolineales bacterium]